MFYEAAGKVKVGWGGFGRRGFQNSSLMLLVDSSKRRFFFQMVDVMVPGVNRLLVLKENLRVQTVLLLCSKCLCSAVFDFLSHVKVMHVV